MREAKCSLATEFLLNKENILLQNERITHLYVIQSESDPFLWFGVLFVDTGPYIGSVVRFNLNIEDSYPDCTCPKITFSPIPYHPLVLPETGELDTKNAFPDWNSNSHKLHQLLSFVKRVIFHPDTYMEPIQELIDLSQTDDHSKEPGANPSIETHSHVTAVDRSRSTVEKDQETRFPQILCDAFRHVEHTLECMRVYNNEPLEFKHRIEEFKSQCRQQLYVRPQPHGDDKNALIFTPWNPKIHEPIRSCVLAGRFAPPSLFASYQRNTDSVSFIPGSGHP